MLHFFIIFFFFLYAICELFKYDSVIKDAKKKRPWRTYCVEVLYIKLVLLIVDILLLVVNRFVSEGTVEQSSSLSSSIIFFVVMLFLVAICIWDIKKSRLHDNHK